MPWAWCPQSAQLTPELLQAIPTRGHRYRQSPGAAQSLLGSTSCLGPAQSPRPRLVAKETPEGRPHSQCHWAPTLHWAGPRPPHAIQGSAPGQACPPTSLSPQRNPTRSTRSRAPPPTARLSPTTWTSPTRHAPMCSTSWHSMPRSPQSRSSCARWLPPQARARCASTTPHPRPQPPGPPPSLMYVPTPPQELYLSWVVEARRHILAILQDYPSLRPPIDHLCELLPRLQARYYSIASSSKVQAGLGQSCGAREGLGPQHNGHPHCTPILTPGAPQLCAHLCRGRRVRDQDRPSQ